MKIQSSNSTTSLDKIVIFPFYDYAIPFQRGVQLNLKSYQASCGRMKIVSALSHPQEKVLGILVNKS